MNSIKPQMWAMFCGVMFLMGCASAPQDSAHGESEVNDPIEGFNRSMWAVNYDYLDPYFVRPVSLAYVNYVPDPVRQGIANFLSNLDEPASVINNLVMGNGHKAIDHFNRFWINSTFGLLGLIDVASAAGITHHNNKSFGDAVGHYGVGNGPYVMVPGYGPWTVRESADLVDSTYVPLSLLNIWAGLGKWALEGMETRAALVSQEAMLENSPDPYALTRDAYLQNQDFNAEIEKPEQFDAEEEAYLDDYLDEDF
ncbi:VacJ family lipoprotein [Vibrio sp. Of14-4]|uniref:Putative phospholipid-binding lipoprotein MlaA n=1 Tax=Vibrio aquimaris TaxID=2587862 RepID=A0A5P9CKT4_9VIBR|nr:MULTISPECIES: VacJ family lipoprotein [Vibrio]MCG7489523.1 VacJ family lipoprotein [Vibrio sp. Of14-4]QFT26826.1 putative phospholipid-binding lipoprotein MlaA precursor [Vibrio aquimaris]